MAKLATSSPTPGVAGSTFVHADPGGVFRFHDGHGRELVVDGKDGLTVSDDTLLRYLSGVACLRKKKAG